MPLRTPLRTRQSQLSKWMDTSGGEIARWRCIRFSDYVTQTVNNMLQIWLILRKEMERRYIMDSLDAFTTSPLILMKLISLDSLEVLLNEHEQKLMWLDNWVIQMLKNFISELPTIDPVEIIEEMIEEKQNSPWSCLNKYSKSQRKALQELLQKFNPSSTNQTSLR